MLVYIHGFTHRRSAQIKFTASSCEVCNITLTVYLATLNTQKFLVVFMISLFVGAV